jgi:hypothetical protein
VLELNAFYSSWIEESHWEACLCIDKHVNLVQNHPARYKEIEVNKSFDLQLGERLISGKWAYTHQCRQIIMYEPRAICRRCHL